MLWFVPKGLGELPVLVFFNVAVSSFYAFARLIFGLAMKREIYDVLFGKE